MQDIDDDPPPRVEVLVHTLEPDGELFRQDLWEPLYGQTFAEVADEWAAFRREVGEGVVEVERDELRAVLLWESDLGDTATFVLVGRILDGDHD